MSENNVNVVLESRKYVPFTYFNGISRDLKNSVGFCKNLKTTKI